MNVSEHEHKLIFVGCRNFIITYFVWQTNVTQNSSGIGEPHNTEYEAERALKKGLSLVAKPFKD